MSLSKYLNESIVTQEIGKPIFIIDKAFKGWLSTVNKVIKKVPESAIPDIICAFSQINVLTNSKVVSPNVNKTKNGVSLERDTIHIPISMASDKILKASRDFSIYKTDDDGWKRFLEVSKTISVRAKTLDRWGFRIVAMNSKRFKTPNDMSTYKEKVNKSYYEKNGRYWWVNTDGESTLCHELGHVFDARKKVSDKPEWKEIADKWIKEDNAPQYCIPNKNTYGFDGGNYKESFAEAFSNTIMHSGKDIPKYVYSFIKKII